jgi:hypothetical protein
MDKEKKDTFETTSHKYLPKTICYLNDKDHKTKETTMVLALSIRVRSTQKQANVQFLHSRIVTGVLSAMNFFYKDTYLSPLEEDLSSPVIYKLKDTPLEIGNIKQYLALPIQSRQGRFL